MKVVSSDVLKPAVAPSTWRTWVLLLEKSDEEDWTDSPIQDRDGDRLTL
jgi:hypothetical protein